MSPTSQRCSTRRSGPASIPFECWTQSFGFTDEANYLNHPPFYYGLLAALGPELAERPAALLAFRIINVAIAAAGLATLLLLGRRLGLGRLEFYGFAAMIAATPVLAPLAGSVNNDNLGFAGGAVALLGLYGYVDTQRRDWLALACFGLLLAGAAKLTALMLVGGALIVALALLATRAPIRRGDLAIVAASLTIAATPYLAFMVQFGSPAPNTPAQHELWAGGAAIAGWSGEARLSPLAYTAFFLQSLGLSWMPSLLPRNEWHLALNILPATLLALAIAGAVTALRALVRGTASACDVVVIGGMAAIAATLSIHIAFCYQRHLASGWMMDAYARYYLPLLAVVPMAALALVGRLPAGRLRAAVILFLIAAPIAFKTLGAPLG